MLGLRGRERQLRPSQLSRGQRSVVLGCSCGGRGQLGQVGRGARLPGSSHHSFGGSSVRITDNQSRRDLQAHLVQVFNWALSYFGVQEPRGLRGG